MNSRSGEAGLDLLAIFLMGALCSMAFVLGCVVGDADLRSTVRKELIASNVAHYEVDTKTGKTKFVCIPKIESIEKE